MHTPFFLAFRARLAPMGRRVEQLRQQSLCHLELLLGVTGEIELSQNGRRGMDPLRRGFSSKDSLQTLLPSSPA
jgi:hypothetical protein